MERPTRPMPKKRRDRHGALKRGATVVSAGAMLAIFGAVAATSQFTATASPPAANVPAAVPAPLTAEALGSVTTRQPAAGAPVLTAPAARAPMTAPAPARRVRTRQS